MMARFKQLLTVSSIVTASLLLAACVSSGSVRVSSHHSYDPFYYPHWHSHGHSDVVVVRPPSRSIPKPPRRPSRPRR